MEQTEAWVKNLQNFDNFVSDELEIEETQHTEEISSHSETTQRDLPSISQVQVQESQAISEGSIDDNNPIDEKYEKSVSEKSTDLTLVDETDIADGNCLSETCESNNFASKIDPKFDPKLGLKTDPNSETIQCHFESRLSSEFKQRYIPPIETKYFSLKPGEITEIAGNRLTKINELLVATFLEVRCKVLYRFGFSILDFFKNFIPNSTHLKLCRNK